jgi:hypothetical protein
MIRAPMQSASQLRQAVAADMLGAAQKCAMDYARSTRDPANNRKSGSTGCAIWATPTAKSLINQVSAYFSYAKPQQSGAGMF